MDLTGGEDGIYEEIKRLIQGQKGDEIEELEEELKQAVASASAGGGMRRS